jgi:hypothetical protein
MQSTEAKKNETRRAKRNPRKGNVLLQLKVDGPGIRRGRIPVPDLIKICQETQNAVSRQAEAIKGRTTLHPGPIAASIQQECTLELIGIGVGSATLRFDLAKPQMPLFEEAGRLAAEVVVELAATIKSLGNGGHKKDIAPGVLSSLYNLAGVTETKSVSRVDWIVPGHGGQKRVAAEINRAVRARIATRLSKPRLTCISIDGILDEADFRPTDRKCRIDPALGTPVNCTFGPDIENTVYTLLRKPVRIIGEGTVPPYADRPESVQIQVIRELPSLELGKSMFLANASIEELAAAQNVKPLKNAAGLASEAPDDEEVDTILEEIYASRK